MINDKKTGCSLKLKSTDRIILDMIQETKKMAGETKFLILIVDDFTAKLLSSFLTMSEVLNEGIFSVERLATKRQPFPKYHALYFISPTAESCSLVADDFKDDKNPMYSRIHLFFSHRIMEVTMDNLVTEGVVKRTKTCKELNLSFFIRDKNLFDLGIPDAIKIFSVKNNAEQRDKVLSIIMERLFTVCAVLKEFPHIQYQKSSPLCSRLAELLNEELKNFYSVKTYNEKRGILLLSDRMLDVTTPFLHDYNWETIIYDLFKIQDNELEFNDKKYKLDAKDELWMEYKNMHMAQVFEKLPKDFEEFMQSDLSKVGKTDNLESFDEMANVLHNMKGYKTKTSQFSLHLKLAEEVSNVRKDFNLYRNTMKGMFTTSLN